MGLIHDLTEPELKDLIQMIPKGRAEWSWIRNGETKITGVRISHNGSEITEAHSDNVASTNLIVSAVLGALQRRRSKRSKSALKAAETRKLRRDAKVNWIAKELISNRTFKPTYQCRVCGKKITDTESMERGIGSDCWQTVLEAIQRILNASEPIA
jgi:Family of unknown function (DUF6011)